MAKQKQTLRAILPDGSEITRTTNHDYKFVVAVKPIHEAYGRSGDDANYEWGTWAWCSRLDLAEKQKQSALKATRYIKAAEIVPVVA
jgi:hypothetical protein